MVPNGLKKYTDTLCENCLKLTKKTYHYFIFTFLLSLLSTQMSIENQQ